MDSKYSEKIKELKLIGEYVQRLGFIESDLCEDVDNEKIDKYILTILSYCIDRINRVYIEGEKMYNKYGILKDNEEGANEIKALKEQLSKCWCYGQELNEYNNDIGGMPNHKVTQNNDGTQESEVI
jgi:hypothetical protein